MTSALITSRVDGSFSVTGVDGFTGDEDGMVVVDLGLGGLYDARPLERLIDQLPPEVLLTTRVLFRALTVDRITDNQLTLDGIEMKLRARNAGLALCGLLEPFNHTASGPAGVRIVSMRGISDGEERRLLRIARSIEFSGYLLRANAISTVNGAHFILPSGAHADRYVRVADALRGTFVVERMVDWIAPFVTPESVVLLDSWTLTPIGVELRRRFTNPSFQVFSYDQYPTERESRTVLDAIVTAVAMNDRPHVVALLSVASSGDMLARIKSVLHESLPHVDKVLVALVNTDRPQADVEHFVRIPGIRRFAVQTGAPCDLCQDADQRELVEIDRSKYTPTISARTDLKMLLATTALAGRSFWEACSRAGAVSVHRYDQKLPRQLHLSIDVGALLRDTLFEDDAVANLRHFAPQTDLILVPRHQATTALTAFAIKTFGDIDILEFDRDLGDTEQTERIKNTLKGKRRILILDDVLIRGVTLRRAHRTVQQLVADLPSSERPVDDYQIFGFVLVARPEHASILKALDLSFRQERPDMLHSLHTVIAPGEPCPWCDEEKFWEQFASWDINDHGNARRLARGRIEFLRTQQSDHGGLTHGLSICNRFGKFEVRTDEKITLHSLFGEELSEVAAYGAVACAMQRIRDETNSSNGNRNGSGWCWDVTRIVSAYHDPLLQSAFLRSAQGRELLVPRARGVRKSIDLVLSAAAREHPAAYRSLAAEHAFAVLMGKHSPSRRQDILKSVKTALGEDSRDLSNLLDAAAQQMQL